MTTTLQQPTSAGTRIRNRVLVVLGAVVAAVAVWAIAVPALGIDVQVPDGPGATTKVPLALDAVIGAATISTLAGWALLAILEKFTRKARTIWTVVAVLVFLVTLPFAPGFTLVERAVLALLHLAVAAVLIPGLRWTGKPTA